MVIAENVEAAQAVIRQMGYFVTKIGQRKDPSPPKASYEFPHELPWHVETGKAFYDVVSADGFVVAQGLLLSDAIIIARASRRWSTRIVVAFSRWWHKRR